MKANINKLVSIIFLLTFIISTPLYASGRTEHLTEARVKNYAEVMDGFKYPKRCKKQAIEGEVMVRVLVDQSGDVKKLQVLCSGHEILSEACYEHLNKLKFDPAYDAEGLPVATWVKIPVRFELK